MAGNGWVFPFVILLGLLVFIHELGHFLVARWNNVRIEVFSLGFGKKIFKWKKGATVYCISLIPLGGYVKMFGHSLIQEKIAKKDQPFSFQHKSLLVRTAVVLAGPLMNFFFAVLLVTIMTMVGKERIHPVVGTVTPLSTAHLLGFSIGDRILSITAALKTTSITNWEMFQKIISQNPEKNLSIRVKKTSGKIKNLNILVEKKSVVSDWGFQKIGGIIDGLSPVVNKAIVGIDDPLSLAGQAGLKTFDVIVSINGVAVNHWPEMKDLFKKMFSDSSESWSIQFQRGQSIKETVLQKPASKQFHLDQVGIYLSDVFIGGLKNKGIAQVTGLRKGDRILKINGVRVHRWFDLTQNISAFDSTMGALELEIKREGQIKSFSLEPEKRRVMINGKEETRYMLGIVSGISGMSTVIGGTYTESILNPFTAGWIALNTTLHWCFLTGVYLKKLVIGEVSKKSLGGVISIGRIAYKSYSYGVKYFLEIMSLLSIQLFLLNLLPIPMLDGGHLFFYMIEFITGSPLSAKKMVIAHFIGFLIMMSLFFLVTFNDIDKWINVW